MKKAYYVKDITIIDSDFIGSEVTIFKHEDGGMFGLDASFIDQVLEEDNEITIDPFNVNCKLRLIWPEE